MTKDEAPTSPKDAALTLALEALENHCGNYKLDDDGVKRYIAACDAIKEALAQPEQEPKTCALLYPQADYVATLDERPWVGLTDEEIKAMDTGIISNSSFYAGAFWAEAKLKEKNT